MGRGRVEVSSKPGRRGTWAYRQSGRRARGASVRTRTGRFSPKVARLRGRPYQGQRAFPPLIRVNGDMEKAVLHVLRTERAKRSVNELAIRCGFVDIRGPVGGQKMAAAAVRSLRDQGILERAGGRFRVVFGRRAEVDERLGLA